MDLEKIFEIELSKIKKENRYREFITVGRDCGNFPFAYHPDLNKKIIIWCSNDYLGMGQNKEVIKSLQNAATKYGVGAGGTRNISGNNIEIVNLEQKIAEFHNKDSALIFSSGYVANKAAIGTLSRFFDDCMIFSDSLNHASIIDGIKDSKAEKVIFRHNDVEHLEELLETHKNRKHKIIIFESVYSMNGSIAKISEIVALAKKYQALTYVDEVHAIGLYGKNGAGIARQAKLHSEIDFIQGSFAKAFGVIGGYVASSKNAIDYIRSFAASFIFTTALPPAILAAISKSLEIISSKEGDMLRKKFSDNLALFKLKLKKTDLEILDNNSHIIAIMIRDARKCKEITDILLQKYDIYLQPINYPTVAKGSERLRVTVTPFHNKKMMDEFVTALSDLT
jgi:5-aminolevulinate synthase